MRHRALGAAALAHARRPGWYGLLVFGSSPVAISFSQSHHASGGGG